MIIKMEVNLSGTMRAFDEDTFNMIKTRLLDIVRGYEKAFDCSIECRVVGMYPPVINEDKLYQEFLTYLGDLPFEEVPPMMIAEDFSFYQREVPGVFFYLGSKNEEKDYVYGLHHSKFNFNERILLRAVELYARIIEG